MSFSAGKKTPGATKAAPEPEKDSAVAPQDPDLTDSVSNLKIKDIPPSKSKDIDVIKEFESSNSKKSLSFVVVGQSCEFHSNTGLTREQVMLTPARVP